MGSGSAVSKSVLNCFWPFIIFFVIDCEGWGRVRPHQGLDSYLKCARWKLMEDWHSTWTFHTSAQGGAMDHLPGSPGIRSKRSGGMNTSNFDGGIYRKIFKIMIELPKKTIFYWNLSKFLEIFKKFRFWLNFRQKAHGFRQGLCNLQAKIHWDLCASGWSDRADGVDDESVARSAWKCSHLAQTKKNVNKKKRRWSVAMWVDELL